MKIFMRDKQRDTGVAVFDLDIDEHDPGFHGTLTLPDSGHKLSFFGKTEADVIRKASDYIDVLEDAKLAKGESFCPPNQVNNE